MSAKITVTLPEEVKAEWKEYAKLREMSLSSFIKFAVNTYILFLKKKKEVKQP